MSAWHVLMMPQTIAMLPIHSLAPKRMVMNVLGSIATPKPAAATRKSATGGQG